MGFLGFDNLDDDTMNQSLQATGSEYRMSAPAQTSAPAQQAPAAPAPVVQSTAAPATGAASTPDLGAKPEEKEKDEGGFNIMGLITKMFGI